MSESRILYLVFLLLVAVTVAVLAKRLRVPYTVALVLIGLVVGLSWQSTGIELSVDLILLIFLPPLLFEGCLNMDLEVLKRNALPVFLLAVPGLLLSVILLGGAIHLFLGVYTFGYALLLAAILSPTDPVSVLATFKEAGVGKDLSVIVEGESVFNDGIGVVLFLLIAESLRQSGGESFNLQGGIIQILREVGIGLGIGVVLGVAIHWVLGRIDDHLVEVALSLILAYGSYTLAMVLHGSGVMAVVAAGLILGNYGQFLAMSPSTRITLHAFWDVGAFLANSFVFILMGLSMHPEDFTKMVIWWAVGIFLILMILRAGICYGLMAVARLLQNRPPTRWTFVILWGGLRGTIPIALVLGLTTATFPDLVAEAAGNRVNEARAIVFGVVFLSLIVQGLTIQFVIRKLGLGGGSDEELMLHKAEGRALAAYAAERELEAMKRQGEVPEKIYLEIKERLAKETGEAVEELHGLLDAHPSLLGARRRHIEVRILQAQRTALQKAVVRGVITEDAFHPLRDQIDFLLSEGLHEASEDDPLPEEEDAVDFEDG
ncbi:MAG: sodium:proton antiporter [Planctomycetota bacterium]|nr:sodium:proton antiporter [Planctomycetota bacterium]